MSAREKDEREMNKKLMFPTGYMTTFTLGKENFLLKAVHL